MPTEMILEMMKNMRRKDIHSLCKSTTNKDSIAKIILKKDFGITNFPKTFKTDFDLSYVLKNARNTKLV